MKRFATFLDELNKPKEIDQFRKKVAHIDKVDTRDPSWMDSLHNLMKRRGFDLLGSGKYASVYGNANYRYVIKVFMKDSAYLRWVRFAMENKDNPYVPKIRGKVIKITPLIYAIRLEKLQPAYSMSGPFADAYYKWKKDRSYTSGDPHIDEILEYFGANARLLDLHNENVMYRGSGANKQLVIVDPFYNWFNKHRPGDYTIDPDDFDKSVF